MSRHRAQPSWRFVVLLVFLFAASATTPRIWQQIARSRHKALADRGVSTGSPEVAVAAAKEPDGEASVRQLPAAAPPEPSTVNLPDSAQPTVSAKPKEEPSRPERMSLVLLPATPSLAAASPPEVAPASPPLGSAIPASANPEATTTLAKPAAPAPDAVAAEEKPSQMPAVPLDDPSPEEETQDQPV